MWKEVLSWNQVCLLNVALQKDPKRNYHQITPVLNITAYLLIATPLSGCSGSVSFLKFQMVPPESSVCCCPVGAGSAGWALALGGVALAPSLPAHLGGQNTPVWATLPWGLLLFSTIQTQFWKPRVGIAQGLSFVQPFLWFCAGSKHRCNF